MSLFFERKFPVLRPEELGKAAKAYVIEELQKYINFKKPQFGALKLDESTFDVDAQKRMLKCILDTSEQQLRMYGSVEEFHENVKIYMNFPESHRMFITPSTNSFYITPITYMSLNNEEYICKSDLYVYLQNMAYELFPVTKSNFYKIIIAIFLKAEMGKVIGKLEFVKYDVERFKKIQNSFVKSMERIDDTANGCIPIPATQFKMFDVDSIHIEFTKLIRTGWKEKEYNTFFLALNQLYNTVEPHERPSAFVFYYFNTKVMIESFETAIDENPDLFALNKPNSHAPRVVRQFEDGSCRFVMEEELFRELDIPFQIDDFYLNAIEMEEVMRKYGEEIRRRDVQFIRTPIIRTKHRPVPIREPNSSDFCILAVDGLFEILKQFIFGFKLFQLDDFDCYQLMDLFIRLQKVFDPSKKSRCFLKLRAHYALKELFTNEFYSLKIQKAKNIRDVKKDGFTVENLRNELKYLNLTHKFPEILGIAGNVYEYVNKMKKEKVLRTCDMFDAVEICQLNCVFYSIVTLPGFLHNQKACGRIQSLQCDTCETLKDTSGNLKETSSGKSASSEAPASETAVQSKKGKKTGIQKAKSTSSDTSELLNPKKSNQKKAPESAKNQKPCEAICEKNGAPEVVLGILKPTESASAKSESPVSDVSFKTKKNQKKALESVKNQKSSSEAPPPPLPKKESANCVKCYRTCEMLNETKKELKSTQNKLAMYEKKNLEMEKNERILEEATAKLLTKIDELKNGLEAKDQEIVETKWQNEREMENLAKEHERVLEKKTEEIQRFIGEKEISNSQKARLDARVLQLEQELRRKQQTSLEEELSERRRQLGNHQNLEPEEFNEIHVENIRLKAENEFKEKMIQQLMSKLSTPSGFFPPPNQYDPRLQYHYPNSMIPQKSMNSEYPDSECQICLVEMKTEQKTINCNQCKKQFHSHCASEWLKVKSECPACRGRLLDPNEFPSL